MDTEKTDVSAPVDRQRPLVFCVALVTFILGSILFIVGSAIYAVGRFISRSGLLLRCLYCWLHCPKAEKHGDHTPW